MSDGRFELEEMFAAARAVHPPPGAAERGWAGVQSAIAPAASGGAKLARTTKLAGVVILVAGIALPMLRDQSPEPEAERAAAVAGTTAAERDAKEPPRATEVPAPAPIEIVSPPPSVAPEHEAVLLHDDPTTEASSGTIAEQPRARVDQPRASEAKRKSHAKLSSSPAPTSDGVAGDAGPTASPSKPDGDALRAEAELLGRAWLALRERDHARAQRLLAEHAKRFPLGALVPEREACEKVAACVSGAEGAVDDAQRWLMAHSTSHLANRVAAGCLSARRSRGEIDGNAAGR